MPPVEIGVQRADMKGGFTYNTSSSYIT